MKRFVCLALLVLTLVIPVSTQASGQPSSQACTATITQTEMNNWSTTYNNTVNTAGTAQQAFNAWYAAGPSREVPELACLSRAQMAQVFNVIAQTTWLDPSDQWDSAPASLNFFNTMVSNGGNAYLVTPTKIFYNNGSTLKSGTFTG